MGYYINPKGASKELWLKHNGELLKSKPNWEDVPKDKVPVCLVSSVIFTAAGICFSERELEAFDDPDDKRIKKWYLIEKIKACEVNSDVKDKLE